MTTASDSKNATNRMPSIGKRFKFMCVYVYFDYKRVHEIEMKKRLSLAV